MAVSKFDSKFNSKVSPATITYTPRGKAEQTIDFHTVIFEEHTTQAQVTKYPVQSGLHISNHSIRNNRTIGIRAMISNIRLVDYEGNTTSGRDYGNDATRKVKEAIDNLINSGQECRVVTNLGDYYPVVFTNFKTQQKAGMMDSMEFLIKGEEIIKVDNNNYKAPVPVVFSKVVEPERTALISQLADMGIPINPCQQLEYAEVEKERGFILKGLDAAGSAAESVFEFLGNDPVSNAPEYLLSVTGIDVFGAGDKVSRKDECPEKGADSALLGGMQQVGGCLLGAADDFVESAVEDLVETSMGRLQESIRGFVYDTITMLPESGQTLANAGLGCVVRGVTGGSSEFKYKPGESLPTTEEIMAGHIVGEDDKGNNTTNPQSKSQYLADQRAAKKAEEDYKEALIKITCDCIGPYHDDVDAELEVPPVGQT